MELSNWSNINNYYRELLGDIYSQPMDAIHYSELSTAISQIPLSLFPFNSVLDVGCGSGDAQSLFESLGCRYIGIALGNDVELSQNKNRNVVSGDFHFLNFPDNSVDFIFARHVLEHSPMPLLALMEWHRVAIKYLYLIFPNPEYWSWFGRNHYYVLNMNQLRWILRRAGWKIVLKNNTDKEFRLLCEKLPRVGYEGYLNSPLTPSEYKKERDDL